jgi:hypothetical protein
MVSLPQPCPRCGTPLYNYNLACHNPACPREDKTTPEPFADTDRLTCRDPDLDLGALERAHGRVLSLYRSCLVAGAASVAAEWEALLVASGYGWPARPKETRDGR